MGDNLDAVSAGRIQEENRPPPTSTTPPAPRRRSSPSIAPPRPARTTDRPGRVNLPAVYVPLSRVLLRAPLLPTASLRARRAALAAHPLGAAAIAIASPTLAGAAAGPARDRSLTRYARRAAFRATPSGLLAGVCVGELGPKTEMATGTPAPHVAPSWARVDALARALLDEPTVRERVRLRAAPSVSVGAARSAGSAPGIRSTSPAPPSSTSASAASSTRRRLDGLARGPRPRGDADGRGGGRADELDELLLALVDDGLLQTDLAPPLIGPPPARHLRDWLAALGRAATRVASRRRRRPPGRRSGAAAPSGGAPGQTERDLQAVLIHRPGRCRGSNGRPSIARRGWCRS